MVVHSQCFILRPPTRSFYDNIQRSYNKLYTAVLNGCSKSLSSVQKLFFLHTSTFQLLDKPWSQVSSLLPPVLAFNAYRAQGSAIPLLVDFHRVLLTHALALYASQFVLKKSPHEFIRVLHALGGDSNSRIRPTLGSSIT